MNLALAMLWPGSDFGLVTKSSAGAKLSQNYGLLASLIHSCPLSIRRGPEVPAGLIRLDGAES